MPLTYITAYEALVERLEIRKGEEAVLLIINGAGGNLNRSIRTLKTTSADEQITQESAP